LGGYSTEEKQKYGMAARLLDPIISKSNGLTPAEGYADKGEFKEHDNVWYFKPLSVGVNGNVNDAGSEQGNGTAEHPFIGFTPGNYGAINQNIGTLDKYPLMFFAPGTYNFSGFSVTHGTQTIDNRFDLPNGWGMYGKIDSYKASALGDVRATFFGGLDMDYVTGLGNAPTTLNSIQVINSKSTADNAALYAINSGNVILQNTNIANSFTDELNSAAVYGIYAKHSTLSFERLNDVISGANNVSGTSIGAIYVYSGIGIFADKFSVIDFNGGKNTVIGSAKSAGISSWSEGYGIYAVSSTVNFNGGENAVIGSGIAQHNAFGSGIHVGASTVNFNGGKNTMEGNATEIEGGSVLSNATRWGIFAGGSIVNFNGGWNNITGTGTGGISGGKGYGIHVFNSTINFANSADGKVKINAFGTTKQDGIYANAGSFIKDRYGNDMTSGTIGEYVTFAKKPNGTSGYAVEWINHVGNGFPLDWP
jgi:hypothetical protein